jgi:uncharacterized protein (DUF2336 family)
VQEPVLSQSVGHLDEIAKALAAKDEPSRNLTADRVTDLFVAQAAAFSDQHVAVFDQVIGLLADAIEGRARARLAEKLADVPNAPPGVIRRLATDDISVARPVLARSTRLSDDELIATARARGRDHMLAISERTNLSEPVTDVLVAEGDRVVVNAVASNPTARFSDHSYDSLVERSAADALLHAALARRRDIPSRHMTALFDLAKKAARERLQNELAQASRRAVREAVNASARDIAAETLSRRNDYEAAMASVARRLDDGGLDGGDLRGMAKRGEIEQVICALSLLAQVQATLAERAVAGGDHDLLLTIARSIDLEWDVVRLILSMRKDRRPGPQQFISLSESYGRLTVPTAQRLLRYLHAREAVSTPGQRLTNVR